MRGKVVTYNGRVWPNPPTTPREIGSPTHLCPTIRNGAKILSQSNTRIMWLAIPPPSCHLMRMVLMQRGRRGRRRSLITTSTGISEIRIRRCVSSVLSAIACYSQDRADLDWVSGVLLRKCDLTPTDELADD